MLLYPKTSGAKKRAVCGTLYNRIIIAFCKHFSCFVPHDKFLQYTHIVFFKPLLQYKNGDFTPFSAFLLNYTTRFVFYVVLPKSDEIRFFSKFREVSFAKQIIESEMSHTFVHHDCNRVGQIERARLFDHRNTHAHIVIVVQEFFGKSF